MKKEIFIHSSFLISALILVSILNKWFSLSYWPFWLGGVVGSILPDLDHIIYIFFLEPQELSSQRIVYLIRNRSYLGTLRLLFETRMERRSLIFHSNLSLTVVLVLAFWMFTSSSSLVGSGLVLGMALHLLLDRLQNALYHEPQNGNGI